MLMNVCISLKKKYIEGRDTLFRKVKASKYSTYIISQLKKFKCGHRSNTKID